MIANIIIHIFIIFNFLITFFLIFLFVHPSGYREQTHHRNRNLFYINYNYYWKLIIYWTAKTRLGINAVMDSE